MEPRKDGEAPWWELHPKVFQYEIYEIRKAGFRVRFDRCVESRSGDHNGPERLVARGRIRIKAAKPGQAEAWHGLTVDIVYPDQFPFDKPEVIPVDPPIRRTRHQTRRTGETCYMQEEMEPWSLGSGIARAIEGAKDWYTGHITGKFANEVPAAELLFYLEGMSERIRALLLPEHACAPTDASYGTFDLEWNGDNPGVAVVSLHEKHGGRPPEATRKINERIWRSVRERRNPIIVSGLWFALKSEPAPFSTLGEFEEVLFAHGEFDSRVFRMLVNGLFDLRARRRGWFPIGISYPRRSQEIGGIGKREWLSVCLEWSINPRKPLKIRKLKAPFWDRVTLVGVPSYPVGRADLVRRVGELYPNERSERAHVMIVGVGALGSTVARSLAAVGVGRITIVDPDIMKPGNTVRHEARMPDVGQAKTVALAQILRETNPYVDVEILGGTRGDGAKFRKSILSREHPPALVIVTVAKQAVDGQVDELARRAEPQVPVLHAWLMAQAQVLRAFVHWPGETACVWCCALYDKDTRDGRATGYIIEPKVEAKPFFETSCASPAYPGSGNANALCAHVVTEMALDVLHGCLEKEASHWVFAGNRVRDLDPNFPVEPLAIARRGFRPHGDCPVCANGVTFQQAEENTNETRDRDMASSDSNEAGWASRVLRTCLRLTLRHRVHAS